MGRPTARQLARPTGGASAQNTCSDAGIWHAARVAGIRWIRS